MASELRMRSAASFMLLMLAAAAPTMAQDSPLPLPCAGGCGSGAPQVFVSSGDASYHIDGHVGVVEQLSDRAVLNWESFNVAEGARVEFRQPRDISVALNRIFQQSPSEILGAVDANGQVYLINRNGFVFGESARINTNTLLASSLNIDDATFEDTGLVGALQNNGAASLTAFTDPSGDIIIEAGAELRTAEGGRVLLFAPRVENGGLIETPGGQTLIGAADDSVFLQFSRDSDLRGLAVELEGEGTVVNAGEIIAERGNITLAGLLLEQQGVLRSSTTLDESGSIDLQAKEGISIIQDPARGNVAIAINGGELRVGAGSVAQVLPEDTADSGAIDAQTQARSRISLLGRTIEVGEAAEIQAPGGLIELTATTSPGTRFDDSAVNDTSIRVAADAVIDVSGTTSTVLPMSANQVDLELRGTELADAPQQRDGAIRGEAVSVDRRRGTNFANVQDTIDNLGRGITERLATGGDIRMRSEGELTVAAGARLDVSGGQVRFEDGFIETSQLIQGDELVDISDADPDVAYDGVFRGTVKEHPVWGVTEVFDDLTGVTGARFEEGYVEGKDAGSLLLQAPALDLQAEIAAGVTTGRHQRLLTQALGETPAFARSFDQLPAGGSALLVTLDDISILPGADAAELRAGPDADIPALLVNAETLADSGLGELRIEAQGNVAFRSDVAIVLAPGGSLEVDAQNVLFDAPLRAPGGRLELQSRIITDPDGGNLLLGGRADIDVSGRWVNEFAFRDNQASDPLVLDGGSILLRSAGDLLVDDLAALNANGGAWLNDDGELTGGQGGSVQVLARPAIGRDIRFAPPSRLSAFALTEGGRLEIEGPTLALIERDRLVPALPIIGDLPPRPFVPVAPPVGLPGLPNVTEVDAFVPSALLRDFGFEQITLRANDQVLVVTGNASIRPRQRNFVLRTGAESLPSADSLALAGAATVDLLPDHERRPVSVALEYDSPISGGATDSLAGVILQPGSELIVEPGGALALASSGSLWVDAATLRAPGGDIDLQVRIPDNSGLLNRAQSIRIGAGSVLDASGLLVAQPSSIGLRLGEVLNGGDIRLQADMGWLIIEGASDTLAAPRFDVSGAFATLDLPAAGGGLEARDIASAGGIIELGAAEGGVVQGVFSAANQAPAARTDVVGGRLSITIDANTRLIDEVANANAPPEQRFDVDERNLALVDAPSALDFAFGEDVSTALAARLEVDQNLFAFSGVDSLALNARATRFVSGLGAGSARILLQDDLSVDLRETLSLSAPAISVTGNAAVDLSAAYVSVGDQVINPEGAGALGPAGSGRLSLNAQLVDLIGRSSLSGVADLRIDSESVVRLVGVLNDFGQSGRELLGGLDLDADLLLTADALYPATASRFELGSTADITLRGRGDAPPAALGSYGGELSINARNVSIDAPLLAPGGRLAVNAAGDLVIGESARLATQVPDDPVLFGQLQAGLDWIYPLPNGNVRLFDELPSSGIELDAQRFELLAGGVVDASGGGDLLAWEFISGPGGTTDYLAPGSGRFAILPDSVLNAAPVDPSLADSQLGAGQRLQLGESPLLPAGDYLLLPARYALLPGAVLVEAVPELRDLPAGELRIDADGAPVVAGQLLGFSGLSEGTRNSAYRVLPGSFAGLNSEYRSARANEFFDVGATPADAGAVTLRVEQIDSLAGRIAARGVESRGTDGVFALVAEQVQVLATPEAAETGAAPGAVLTAADLTALDVGAVVLGAELSEADAGGTRVEARAERVLIGADVDLALPELLLAARSAVVVESGAQLRSTAAPATSPRNAVIDGGAAALWLTGDSLSLERSAAAGAGRLTLAEGTAVATAGTLVAQGPGGAALQGELSAAAADLLGDRLRLRATPEVPAAQLPDAPESGLPVGPLPPQDEIVTELNQLQLAGLSNRSLVLQARRSIQVVGAVALGGTDSQRFALLSPSLEAVADASLAVTADTVVLGAGASALPARPEDETRAEGLLSVDSNRLVFTEGAMVLDAFAAADLVARTETVGETASGLSVSGDLQLRTPLLTAANLTPLSLSAAGNLTLLGSTGNTAPLTAAGIGAELSLSGATVEVNTLLHAPSGRLRLAAVDGDLTLGSGAVLDVAGTTLAGQTLSIRTPGGDIALQAAADVNAAAGSLLSVSGPEVAGGLQIQAGESALIEAQLDGSGSEQGAGFSIDAGVIAQLDPLNARLRDGGFDADRSYRVRRGDLVFGGTPLAAADVTAISDAGRVVLPAALDLAAGSRALLAGADGVTFDGGLRGDNLSLWLESYNPQASFQIGGPLEGTGQVVLVADASIAPDQVSVAFTNPGDGFDVAVELTTSVAAVVAADEALEPPQTDSLDGAGLEVVRAVDVIDTDRIEAFAEALAEDAPALDGLALPENVQRRQGLRVTSENDLRLQDLWDLSEWREQVPGRLLLTAAGDIELAASITDGFREAGQFNSPRLQQDDSWSLLLAAGSALSDASGQLLADDSVARSLRLRDGVQVRTGTGGLDVLASGDLDMSDGVSALYTVGTSTGLEGFDEDIRFFAFHDIEFPVRGGDIRVAVGGDVLSTTPSQNVTDYTVRLGGELFGGPIPTINGVAFNRFAPTGQVIPAFQQGIGSFAGGQIHLEAGGDAENLVVVAPERFRHVGDAVGTLEGATPNIQFTDNAFAREGSDRVRVRLGGAIDGGFIYVGSGEGQIDAGSISAGDSGLGLLLAQSSSRLRVQVAGEARIAGVLDPMVTTQSLGSLPNLQGVSERVYYFSYTDDTAFSLHTLGDVALGAANADLAEQLPQPGAVNRDLAGLNVLPGTLELSSATGDVLLLPAGEGLRASDLLLFPSPVGGVAIAASGDVLGPDASLGGTLLISDADADLLPSPENPQADLAQVEARFDTSVEAIAGNIHARVPVHLNDPQISRIESLTGSVEAPGLSVVSAEALTVTAARSLSLAAFDAQNVRDDDVSSLVSGEDIEILANRNPDTGAVSGNSRVVRVSGPGSLEVIAGGSVDLGTSVGIETTGNLDNPVLAERGADVLLLTGNAGAPDFAGFFAAFVAEDSERREQLAAEAGFSLPDAAAANDYFATLPVPRQRTLVVQALFEELNASGLLASQLIAQEAPAGDIEIAYQGGQQAVATLFPDSGDDFLGDLSLFFSKIQTLDGGNIDILVPGGGVNVGLSVSFGAEKSAAELGIVAQGEGNVRVLARDDIEVNRSRVFTLNGGDISLWSSSGDIDAGRGAKTALATPPLVAVLGENDTVLDVLPPAIVGSGIAADDGTSGRLPDILLSTPEGVVDAGDAGIRTPGRLFTAAVDVVGRDNIDAGSFVGAPADTVVLSADIASVGDSASSATQDLATAVAEPDASDQAVAATAAAALGWLEVFLEGFGPEFCDPALDTDCKEN